MLASEADFQSRRTEVDEYLAHLGGMEQVSAISITLMNTMKSSTLLMIYNIVESTMANLMQDIFDELESSKVPFEKLNKHMREVVLGRVKRGSPKLIVERMDAPAGFVFACFDRSESFSGNLDSKVIRETLRDLGLAGAEKHRERALLSVKTQRNNLAHGLASFSSCGKDYSVKDLLDLHHRSCAALERVIKDVDSFLMSKAYL